MSNHTSGATRPTKIAPRPMNPVASVLNHLPMVVILTFGILVVGAAGVMVSIKPFYSAESILKIEPVIPTVLYGKEEASIMPYYDDFVRTQITQVKSYPVLARAIELCEQGGFSWKLADESVEQAVDRLAVRLNISQLRDSQLFSLSMTSRRREGLAEVINATVDAYLTTIADEQMSKDASRLSFLRSRKLDTESDLEKKYAVLQEISAKYAVGITDEKNIYVYLQAIVDLTQQLIKATSRRIEVESKLKELQQQLDKLKTIDIESDVDEWVENDSAVRDNRIQLSRKLQDMRLFLAGVNESHPDRREYEESVQRLYEVNDSMLKRSREVGEKVIRGKLLSDQNRKILDLQTEYAAALKTEEKLRSELAEAERKATDVNTQMMQASTLRREIQRLQDSLLRIDERIDQIEVESRSPERITRMTAARTPENPSAGKRTKMMVLVLLASLLCGIGYAVARDKLDDRIHTTGDVERVLGFPPSGIIIDFQRQAEMAQHPYRVVQDHPYTPVAEQFKAIAFSLSKEHEDHESSLFACLPLNRGQGASTFTTNTLSAIRAQPHKKILVDLNVWNPLAPRLLSDAGAGLWDVLEGTCTLKEAIIRESPYPYHILPFGNRPAREQDLFREFGIDAMLHLLRQDYDYVMLESPPLLLSTDAKFLSRLADVSVLIVGAEQAGEKELFKAVNSLDRAGVKVISVVLNRARLKRAGDIKSSVKDYIRMVGATASGEKK